MKIVLVTLLSLMFIVSTAKSEALRYTAGKLYEVGSRSEVDSFGKTTGKNILIVQTTDQSIITNLCVIDDASGEVKAMLANYKLRDIVEVTFDIYKKAYYTPLESESYVKIQLCFQLKEIRPYSGG